MPLRTGRNTNDTNRGDIQAIALDATRPTGFSADAVSNDPAYADGSSWFLYGDATNPTNPYGTGAGEAWAAGYVGSMSVAVGVIDSGIDYTHPDLYQNIWLNRAEIPAALLASLGDTDGDRLITFRDLNSAANAAFVSDLNGTGYIDAGDLLADVRWENGVDEDGNGYVDDLIGWDTANDDNDPYDDGIDGGHGTGVAGVIGAMAGNGTGSAGINWNVQLVALKSGNAEGVLDARDLVEAMDYFTAAAQASEGINFVATNNSYSGHARTPKLEDATDRAADAGILTVAAASNGGKDGISDDNDRKAQYPASDDTSTDGGPDGVIAVASINRYGFLSGFSNYGLGDVDLAAPGEAIYVPLAGGGYGYVDGTSFAAPQVTGAIALYAAAHPNASAETIRAALFESTEPTASLAGKTVTGGRLDIAEMLGVSPPPVTTNPATELYGTNASERIVGTAGPDVLSGVPATGTSLGKGTIDILQGGAGDDLFMLGDRRGVFYDDGNRRTSGLSDYALIEDFQSGSDRISLHYGSGDGYWLHAETVQGISGTSIYWDNNGHRAFDEKDELIGVVAGVTPEELLGNDSFAFL